MRIKYRWLLVCMTVLSILWPVSLSSSNKPPPDLPVTGFMPGQAEYWLDSSGQANLTTAIAADFLPAIHFSRGDGQKALWLRIPLYNLEPSVKRILRMGPALLQSVELWQTKGSTVVSHQLSGFDVPMSQRSMPEQEVLFPLTLASGTHTLYLRILNPVLSMPYIEFREATAWNKNRLLFNMRTGFTYGILLVLIIMALIHAAWTRQIKWIYPGLALCAYIFYESCYEGVAALWFWPQEPALSWIVLPVSLILVVVFVTLFILESLLPHHGKVHAWWTSWSLPIPVLMILALVLRMGVDLGWWTELYPVDLWFTSWSIIVAGGLVILAQMNESRKLQMLLTENISQISCARDQANRASRSKSLLLARISHDLRTPLHTLIGYVDMAQRERPEGVMGRYLKIIANSSQKMVALIDEMLQFVRGEEGRLELNPKATFLHGLIQQLNTQAEILAAPHNDHFELVVDLEDEGIVVVIDTERLYAVLINLLSNACRATVSGIVTLSITSYARSENVELSFSVRDTGPGIAPEDQERIFLPFEHGSSDTHSVGLGLAIARQLVRLMGGELVLQSQPGAGAHFKFSLVVPRAHEADVLPAANFTAPYGYNGPVLTLLIVDDVPENRMFMQDMLTGMGFDVRMAEDVPEALSEACKYPLSGAIVDQYLPSGSGWEILDAMKTLNPELPVILLSAAPGCPPVTRKATWQFDAQLLKPIRVDELTQTLGRLLNLVWRFNDGNGETAIVLQELPTHPIEPDDLRVLRQMAYEGSLFEVEDWIEKWQHRAEERDFIEQLIPLVATARLSAIVQLVDRRLDQASQTN